MSKIEEMAESAFPNDVGFLYLSRRTGYMRGAKEVLKEIEKEINAPYNLSFETLRDNLLDKIRELKGE